MPSSTLEPTRDATPAMEAEAGAAASATAREGELREAVWELLLRNAWLENEVERLSGAVSAGYVRRLPAAEAAE